MRNELRLSFCRWLMILVVMALLGCQEERATPAGPPPTLTRAILPTPTRLPPTATPTPRPTLPPSPTPIIPAVSVTDQTLADDGQLTINHLASPAPAWLVAYADENGRPERIIGNLSVPAGIHDNLTMVVDPLLATSVLHLALHADNGLSGQFEFPGPDGPYAAPTAQVSFVVDIRALIPAIVIANQPIGEAAGQVIVDNIIASEPGWVVIYDDDNGQPGRALGQSPVKEGLNESVVVTLDWRMATPTLYAALYRDGGTAGLFEPESDQPVLVNNAALLIPFTVTLPPDVFVVNQPATNRQLFVERAVTNAPGWLVIYTDADSAVNLIIGYIHLEAGVNENLVVDLDTGAITPTLHAMIHEDNDPAGTFDFPNGDLPVRYEGELRLFSFRTDGGNYLVTRDQELSDDNQVIIPMVVTDVPTWVVVRNEVNGVAGELLGLVLIPAGVHHDIVVELDPAQLTNSLHVILHQDAGTLGQFEYPDGLDFPLQRNRQPITVTFSVE